MIVEPGTFENHVIVERLTEKHKGARIRYKDRYSETVYPGVMKDYRFGTCCNEVYVSLDHYGSGWVNERQVCPEDQVVWDRLGYTAPVIAIEPELEWIVHL